MSESIGQTFLVDTLSWNGIVSTGIYLTKIDLYFATKDPVQSVIVNICEIDPLTGAFTGRVLPFATKRRQPADINTSSDGSIPTPFVFPSPVYLLDGKEYGFQIIPGGGSPNFTIFTSRLGENDLATGTRVSQQPAVGILFASGSDKTFTGIDEEDIKYTLYYANFNLINTGQIKFKNDDRDYLTVANVSSDFSSIGESVHGETLIRGTFAKISAITVGTNVNNDVCFIQGMTSGATATVSSNTRIFNGQIRVKNVSTASKFKAGETIRIRNTNSTTGRIIANGSILCTVTPTGKIEYYDRINYSNTHLHLANVSYINSGPIASFSNNRMFTSNTYIRSQTLGYTARILGLQNLKLDVAQFTSDYISPANTAITFAGRYAKSSSSSDSSYSYINVNDTQEFPESKYVLSYSNEANTSASNATMKDGSLNMNIHLASTCRLVSPAIDVDRISLTSVENLINSNTDIQSTEDYVSSGGSAKTRYITRRITLADGQDAEDILVYLNAYKPSTANIFVYYKIIHKEDSDTFLNTRWMPMTQNTASTIISDTENTEDFKEYVYSVKTYPTNTQKVTRNGIVVNLSGANNTTGVIEYRNSLGARFTGYKYLAIKIVMTNTVTVKPPRITDLRVICLQK